RGTRNSRSPHVDRVEAYTQVRSSVQACCFFFKFAGQRFVEPLCLSAFKPVIPHPFTSLLQQTCTLHSGPRANSKIACLHITKRRQTIKERIYPAVYGYVRRAHVFWIATRFTLLLQEVAPRGPPQFRIVVCPVNLPPKVPAQRTSHHSVRCEVL